MTPQPPLESYLSATQRQALNRIQRLLGENFRRGLVTVVYAGTDDKMHVQVISNSNSPEEEMDLAKRTVQQVEIAHKGIITTLTGDEKRIVAP